MLKQKTKGLRNQRIDVLNYLKKNGSITQLEAYNKFPAPITRLSSVIYDLRKEGYDITSEDIEGSNCYGKYSCCKYILNKNNSLTFF